MAFTYMINSCIIGNMSRTAAQIVLCPKERSIINMWARGKSFPIRLVQRSQIIQMAADGILNQDIALTLGTTRLRYNSGGIGFWLFVWLVLEKTLLVPGLPKIPAEKIAKVIEATLHTKPSNATHWAARTMATAQGLVKQRFGGYGSSTTLSPIW